MKNGLALIIGNAKYPGNSQLVNAVNDAKDVSKKLLSLGFVVINQNDCTTEDFDRQIQEFGEELNDYKVGLFYYAGHGFQIDGKNYLTGIDTSFHDKSSAKHTSISLDEIIERMQEASPEVKILILDACRDNPLPSLRGVSYSGLAPIYAPKGTLIAFSTSPGEKAKDTGAGRNSIYTGAFLKHIDDENIPIEEFFKRVRTSVFAHSNGSQTSWEHTSLIGDFYFNSGQLIHSKKLPYKREHIADAEFNSTGSEIDEIVLAMKSYNWYTQSPALSDFRRMDKNSLSNSYLFLIGRNILQMADGSERDSIKLMGRLNAFLDDYFRKEENHLLNGILFEMYFNSRGLFRQTKFKNKFINEICSLQRNTKYQKSFNFINRQLKPFKDYVFYMPSSSPKSLPIEIGVLQETEEWRGKRQKIWKIVSIKNNNVELLHHQSTYSHSTSVKEFMKVLASTLSVPGDQLTVTWNEVLKETAIVGYPWEFSLSRIPPEPQDSE